MDEKQINNVIEAVKSVCGQYDVSKAEAIEIVKAAILYNGMMDITVAINDLQAYLSEDFEELRKKI